MSQNQVELWSVRSYGSACPFHLPPHLFLLTYVSFPFLDLFLLNLSQLPLEVPVFSLASSCTVDSCITRWVKHPPACFYYHPFSTPFCASEATHLLLLRITGNKKLQKFRKVTKKTCLGNNCLTLHWIQNVPVTWPVLLVINWTILSFRWICRGLNAAFHIINIWWCYLQLQPLLSTY